MAKTHRRRAARIARQAAAASARAKAWSSWLAAKALLTNHDWKQLTETLDGLLRIEFPSPFLDKELLCPKEAWLVVDLTYVRVNASAASSLRQGILRVVEALEKICVHAETLRAWKDLYTAFWTRVLTSDMNQDQLNDRDLAVVDLIRFMGAKGTHVAFRWHGRRLHPGHVIEPLRRFLDARLGTQERRHVPVQVGLRFEQCQLTMADLKAIHDLLKTPSSADSDLLCEAWSLKQLVLSSNALYEHHLDSLTAILEDASVRRVDNLGLDDITPRNAELDDRPRGAILPATYAAILQRTVSMALRSRKALSTDPAIQDNGIRLSFDGCSGLDAEVIEAIENALIQATRPVSALSLACVVPPDFGSLMRICRLIHTPLPTATDDFELDISCLNADHGQDEVEEALVVSLAEMVTEAIPRIYSAGLVAGEWVTCRLLIPQVFEDQFLSVPVSAEVSAFEFYEVVFVTHNGFFQLALPEVDEHGRRLLGWVSSTAIANIRIGNATIVGSNCKSLILDGSKGSSTSSQFGRFVSAMVATTGACLERFSLRSYPRLFNDMPNYMARCPRLAELNACSTGGEFWNFKPSWSQASPDTGRSLQILNISDCRLDADGLRTIPELPSLKSLHIVGNALNAEALDCVLERLRISPSLQFVAIVKKAELEGEQEQRYGDVKTKIDKHLRDEYVALDARVAFLSVMTHAEQALGLSQCVPLDAIASIIFRFAGTRPRCVVSW